MTLALLTFAAASVLSGVALTVAFIRWLDPSIWQGEGFYRTATVSLVASYVLTLLGCLLLLVA